jgi:thiol:disulfide interchange protein DsbA
MNRFAVALCAVLALGASAQALASRNFVEGTDYSLIVPAQATHVPKDKIEVMEVFSYGCIACNGFQPVMAKVRQGLPANARLVYLPASFIPSEDWVVLQRAYFTAQSLGIAERTHQAMFDAIWKSGELSIHKQPQPTLQDVARWYARNAGVSSEKFLAAAGSASIDAKMRAADAQVKAMHVPGTPDIVVNGKYRVELNSLHNIDDVVDVIRFLVAKESGGGKPAPASRR